MVSLKPVKGGGGAAQYYYEDFYIEGGGSQGMYYGTGANNLGLAGAVKTGHFKNLLSGFSPDGKAKLVTNAGSDERQQGWDLCFNPAKSISVFYALSSSAVQAQVDRDIQKALADAVSFVEERAGLTRRGAGGNKLEPASLIFATFQHLASRANDPHLHIHAVLINAAVRADGTTGTIWSPNIYNNKMQAGSVFAASLAVALKESLGLDMRYVDGAWEIAGVPWKLCNDMSQRRTQIKEALRVKNLFSAAASAIAALETRPSKDTQMTRDQLFESWKVRADAFGWSTEQAEALIKNPRFQKNQSEEQNHSKEERRQKMHEKESSLKAESNFNKDWTYGRSEDSSRSRREDLRDKNREQFFKNMRESEKKDRERAAKDAQAQDFTKRKDDGWREVLWNKNLLIFDFRLQNRLLFPKAPYWSPFRNWQIPTLRLIPKLPLSYHLWTGIKESLAKQDNESKRDHKLSEERMRRGDRPRRENMSNVRMDDFFRVDIQALREQNYKQARKDRRAAMSKMRRAEKRRSQRVSKVRGKSHDQGMSYGT